MFISDDASSLNTEVPVQNCPSVHEIPIRATLLSALSVIPFVLITGAIYLSSLSNEQVGVTNRIVLQLLSATRCPTIGWFLFHKIFFGMAAMPFSCKGTLLIRGNLPRIFSMS